MSNWVIKNDKKIIEYKGGEYIPYREVVPVTQRAVKAAQIGANWLIGVALPKAGEVALQGVGLVLGLVLRGGYEVVRFTAVKAVPYCIYWAGEGLKALCYAIADAMRRDHRTGVDEYRPIERKPNVHITTNVNVRGGDVYVENNIQIW